MARSASPSAGKYLNSGGEQFDRNLQFADETSPRSETCLDYQYFPTD